MPETTTLSPKKKKKKNVVEVRNKRKKRNKRGRTGVFSPAYVAFPIEKTEKVTHAKRMNSGVISGWNSRKRENAGRENKSASIDAKQRRKSRKIKIK